jgi:hypothetical protein
LWREPHVRGIYEKPAAGAAFHSAWFSGA